MRPWIFPQRTAPELPSNRSRKAIATEVAIAFSITVVVIAGLTQLSKFSTLILENTSTLAAALFIFLPLWLLRRDAIEPEKYAIRSHGLRRQLLAALLLSALILPIYFFGYHLFQTEVQSRSLRVDEGVFLRWPQSLEGRPVPLRSNNDFQLWDERGTCTLLWPSSQSGVLEVSLELDAVPRNIRWVTATDTGLRLQSPTRFNVQIEDTSIRVKTTKAAGLRFDTQGATQLRVELSKGGQSIPRETIKLGRYGLISEEDAPLTVERGWLWIVLSLLIHIVLVGTPEEIFYRGYVQTRLQTLFTPRWSLLGVRFGPALFFTSILFALGHYLIELDPNRLMVFFPSLLFGWIRNWTDHIAAAAIFHGLCNVSILLIAPMYVG